MEQLLAHLVGDYCLQNHWMAVNKTKLWVPAVVHGLFYGLPFLLLIDNPWQLWAIVATHVVIDRLRLARYWVEWWGVGSAGRLPLKLERWYHVVFTGDNAGGRFIEPDDEEWTGEWNSDSKLPKSAPPFLATWLLIIVDNTMHLCINYAVLRWM